MRDPESVARAQRAASTLERAWRQWRVVHGLRADQMPAVSSFVGYSLEEPWGQPRVVFGLAAEDAEHLALLLDRHDCIGPVHAMVAGRSEGAAAGPRAGGVPPGAGGRAPATVPAQYRPAAHDFASGPREQAGLPRSRRFAHALDEQDGPVYRQVAAAAARAAAARTAARAGTALADSDAAADWGSAAGSGSAAEPASVGSPGIQDDAVVSGDPAPEAESPTADAHMGPDHPARPVRSVWMAGFVREDYSAEVVSAPEIRSPDDAGQAQDYGAVPDSAELPDGAGAPDAEELPPTEMDSLPASHADAGLEPDAGSQPDSTVEPASAAGIGQSQGAGDLAADSCQAGTKTDVADGGAGGDLDLSYERAESSPEGSEHADTRADLTDAGADLTDSGLAGQDAAALGPEPESHASEPSEPGPLALAASAARLEAEARIRETELDSGWSAGLEHPYPMGSYAADRPGAPGEVPEASESGTQLSEGTPGSHDESSDGHEDSSAVDASAGSQAAGHEAADIAGQEAADTVGQEAADSEVDADDGESLQEHGSDFVDYGIGTCGANGADMTGAEHDGEDRIGRDDATGSPVADVSEPAPRPAEPEGGQDDESPATESGLTDSAESSEPAVGDEPAFGDQPATAPFEPLTELTDPADPGEQTDAVTGQPREHARSGYTRRTRISRGYSVPRLPKSKRSGAVPGA